MTKQNILDYFKDINHAYNDCTKYDTLKSMLDELQDPLADAKRYFNSIYELSQKLDVTYDFIDEKIKGIIQALSLQESCDELDFVQPHKKVSVNLELCSEKMQMVINVPKNLVCEGFERPFTEEEKNVLIKAIGNGTPL